MVSYIYVVSSASPRRSSWKLYSPPRSYEMVQSPPSLGEQDQRDVSAKSPSFGGRTIYGTVCVYAHVQGFQTNAAWERERHTVLLSQKVWTLMMQTEGYSTLL